MARWRKALPIAAILLLVVALVEQRRKAQLVETRLAELEARVAAMPHAVPTRVPTRGPAPAMARPRPGAAMPAIAPPAGDAPPPSDARAVVDDHLWSEEGRAAIDDVVAAREAERHAKERARWRAFAEARTDRFADDLAEELDLDDGTAEALRGVLHTHREARSARWERMHDADADPSTMEAEAEAARAAFEADVVALIGQDGFAVLDEKLSSRRRGF